MDAFFASVEERDRPYLKGKPLVIGSDPKGGKGRGVVSTASYAARKYGVHSALPISKAWNFCEKGKREGGEPCVFITGGFGKYSKASKEVFKVVSEIVPNIQQVGIDEAYLDLSFTKSFTEAKKIARIIQHRIRSETGLTGSIGIGPNKLIAKVASDYKKPRGLTVVTSKRAEKFLEVLPLRSIPGIGPKAMQKFSRRGMQNVLNAKKLSWEQLGKMFGKWGFGMYEKLRGIDERPLSEAAERKSIGKHYTFHEDTRDMKEVIATLKKHGETIIGSMHRKKFKGFRTTVLTVRFDDFTTKSRSVTVKELLKTQKDLETKAVKLVLPFFEKTDNPQSKAIRLIGLRIEKLE